MPRGVVIPELRQQLFAAAERVVTRDGPDRLTGRAVTTEAGVATGLLHAHFGDFDGFLTGYAVDRSFELAAGLARLPDHPGDPADAVADTLLGLPRVPVGTLLRLLAARPRLRPRIAEVLGDNGNSLDAMEHAVRDHLTTAQHRGRLPDGLDPAPTALVLVALLHHLLLTEDAAVDERFRATAAALLRRADRPAR